MTYFYSIEFEFFSFSIKIHVQTIGILVAEKTDITAKLTQSIKQIERKQSEIDEIQGRLKASRERVEELEKSNQNSSSNAQKHELVCCVWSLFLVFSYISICFRF